MINYALQRFRRRAQTPVACKVLFDILYNITRLAFLLITVAIMIITKVMVIVIMITIYNNNCSYRYTTILLLTPDLPPNLCQCLHLSINLEHAYYIKLLPHTEMRFCLNSASVGSQRVPQRNEVLRLLEEENRDAESNRHLYPNNYMIA